jgi:glycosyl hydrolase family 26
LIVFGRIVSVLVIALVTSSFRVTEAAASASAAVPPPQLGVYRGDAPSGPDKVDAYSAWLGRKVDLAEAFEPGATWDDVMGRSWQLRPWSAWVNAQPGRRLVLTIPILPGHWDGRGPTSGPGAGEPVSLERGAAGDYDRYFVALARNLVAYRLGNTILRLGHEFNGGWYTWRASGKEAAFAGYWRRIVTAMTSVPGHELQFNWNPTLGHLGMRPDLAWPGDAYVDIVGLDVYDQSWSAGTYPIPAGAAHDDARRRQALVWAQILDGAYGLRFWQRFGEAHGKPLAISEWGLSARADGRGGGDNPDFIANMWRFIHDPANRVAYHVYFDIMARDGGHQLSSDEGFTSPFSASAATYRRLFGHVAPPPGPAARPAPDIRPRLSKASNRSRSHLLARRTLPARAFIFVAASPSVRHVSFRMDDPGRRRRPIRTDSTRPFDLVGGSARGALAFRASRLRAGPHKLTVTVRLTDGRLKVAHASFRVRR